MHWIKYRVTTKNSRKFNTLSVHFKTLISYKNGYFCRAYLVHVFYFLNFFICGCMLNSQISFLRSHISSHIYSYLAVLHTWHDGAWIQITFFGGALKSIYCFKPNFRFHLNILTPLGLGSVLKTWLVFIGTNLLYNHNTSTYLCTLVDDYDEKKKVFDFKLIMEVEYF